MAADGFRTDQRAHGNATDAHAASELSERIDDALPQTQCRRCGYPSCRDYARAIGAGEADIDRCPPGGAEGVSRLAAITGRSVLPIDATCGAEGPRLVAWIVEPHCIGCTLCIAACPVDCIVGAPKRLHTIVEAECTGCELCVPACPVDCIVLECATPGRSGWHAWTLEQARASKTRFQARSVRNERLARQNDERMLVKAKHKLDDLEGASQVTNATLLIRKRELVEAAVRRAQQRLSNSQHHPTPRPTGDAGKIET